jgi:hypothetical protein
MQVSGSSATLFGHGFLKRGEVIALGQRRDYLRAPAARLLRNLNF